MPNRIRPGCHVSCTPHSGVFMKPLVEGGDESLTRPSSPETHNCRPSGRQLCWALERSVGVPSMLDPEHDNFARVFKDSIQDSIGASAR